MIEKSLTKPSVSSFTIAFYICTIIVIWYIGTNEQFFHWFVIPVLLCGVLITGDAVEWLRGRMDTFDPVGILGLLGFHFFFLAPLLHVSWDYWMGYIIPPQDWRPWLGGMALLNFVGLLFYRTSRNFYSKHFKDKSEKSYWRLDKRRFVPITGIALIVTGILQAWLYVQQGGILGYINTFTSTGKAFEGMGWLFVISESFPIIAMIGFAVYASKRKGMQSWLILLIVLAVFFILQMFFGGFRGSRSNTVWALFWAVGIINFWIRPVSRKLIFVGLTALVLFMYIYGFYKTAGLEALNLSEGPDYRLELEQHTGRTFEGLLLGDLGRSDVQAFLLYRLTDQESDYNYALGRTYLGAAVLLIPKSVWADRPDTKIKEGTEALRGAGSYIPGVEKASNVYGLAGETMLNFGLFLVPFAFIILGVAVSIVRHYISVWAPTDARLLLVPLIVNLCFTILTSDSDNLLFFVIKSGFIPFLVIMLSSIRRMTTSDYGGGHVLLHKEETYMVQTGAM